MKVGDRAKVTERGWGDHRGATGVVDWVGDNGYVSLMLDGYPFRYYATFPSEELSVIEEGQA